MNTIVRNSLNVRAAVASDAARGVGSALYVSLFEMLKSAGYHTVLGVIALPNAASIALHEKFGKWHDVGNWQLEW